MSALLLSFFIYIKLLMFTQLFYLIFRTKYEEYNDLFTQIKGIKGHGYINKIHTF